MINKALNFQFSIFNFQFSGKRIIQHPLFSGSAAMIIGSNLANFIAYIYHLVVGRMLGPSSYSELAVMISVITMFTVSFGFLGLVIVKFVSAADERDLGSLLAWFVKKALVLGIVVGGIAQILSPLLSNFLHIDLKITSLLGLILLVMILGLVYRSFLQGLLKFKEVALLSNFDMMGRLILGTVLIYLGFSVFGAIFGLLISSFSALLLARFFLRDYRGDKTTEKFSKGKNVFNYAVPIFFSSFATNSFFSADVILVKHFFDSHTAGIYASLSNLGKIIYFATAPIASVMFPLVSQRHSQGDNYRRIFLMSFALTFLMAAGISTLYLIFPDLAVKTLYGEKFLEASRFLFIFGIFISIFTLSSLVASYYLSLGKTKVVIYVTIAALSQMLGIFLFHKSILSVIYVSMVTASFLLIGLLIYFIYETSKGQKREKTS